MPVFVTQSGAIIESKKEELSRNLGPGYTEDTIGAGAVRVFQPRRGYRFSIDAVMLADFAARRSFSTAVDLGCATGVVTFLIAQPRKRVRVTGIDIQRELVDLGQLGIQRNGLEGRVELHCFDLRKLGASRKAPIRRGACELVVANPPFYAEGSGRLSPRASKVRAHHDSSCTLEDVMLAAKYACAPRGWLSMILPAERLPEALDHLPKGFRPTAIRMIHARIDKQARRVLLEARRGGRETLEVLPSLVIHERGGYTPELRRMLGE